MTKDEAKKKLRQSGLRVTAPRLAVLRLLANSETPLSHTEALERLGQTDWDPATVYRNLIKLKEADLAFVASRADGIVRYAFGGPEHGAHLHPHFVCEDCGTVSCLPPILAPIVAQSDRWAASLEAAMVQLRGECPDCLEQPKADV